MSIFTEIMWEPWETNEGVNELAKNGGFFHKFGELPRLLELVAHFCCFFHPTDARLLFLTRRQVYPDLAC